MTRDPAPEARRTPEMRLRDRAEFASKPEPLTMRPEAMVSDAVAQMCRRGYGSVVVTDPSGKVEGIATERDVLRLVDEGRDATATPLSAIMTANPRVARADDDVLDWLRIMSNERFRRLPVVDADGRVTAVFTQGDFVSYTWPELLSQARELTKATMFRNWHLVLIGGGIMVYSLAMVAVLAGL